MAKKNYALDIAIGATTSASFGSTFKAASNTIKNFASEALKQMGPKGVAIGVGIAAAAGTAKLAWDATKLVAEKSIELMGAAIDAAGEFEQEMANVSTLLSGSSEEVAARVEELGDSVIDISNKTGVATGDLTDGLYQVISAYGDTAESAQITELAAKSGAAGAATTTDAINLLSAVTKAYGDTSYEANEKVSDMAFETVRLGQTTYGELASSVQQVTALSSAMGVSQEEMFGVFAAGTGVIGSAAEVGTKLKAVYTKLQKPTKEMSNAFKEMGYESGEAMIEQLGLQGTLDAITEYSKDAGISLSKLYGSSNAAILATAMTGDLSGALSEKTAAMGGAEGATDTAFEKQTGTYEYQMNMLKNLGQNALVEIGQQLLPHLTSLATSVFPVLTSALEQIMPAIGQIFASIDFSLIGELASSLIPLILQAITGILPIIQQLIPPLMQFGTQVLSQLIPPLITIAQNLLPILLPLLQPILDIITSLMPLLTTMMSVIQPIVTMIVSFIGLLINQLNPFIAFISGFASILMGILGSIMTVVSNIVSNIINAVSGLFTKITGVIKGIVNIIIRGVNWIIDCINKFLGGLNKLKIPDWVPGVGGKGFNIALIPKIPEMAKGGIVTDDTIARIGEGNESEAVIPLSKLDTMINGGIGNGEITITFAPVINVENGDPDAVKGVIDDEFEKFKTYMEVYLRQERRLAF